MIQAQILADSINPQGDRITTMKVTFPRIVLAEFNTHRMFSRNSASSRAIPFKKMVQMVKENPFIPIAWQKDHKGMQGTEYHDSEKLYSLGEFAEKLRLLLGEKHNACFFSIYEFIAHLNQLNMTLSGWWLYARDRVLEAACIMYIFGVTKQIVNRLLEPFMWHTVIVTATEWENFFKLRCPQYAYKFTTEDVGYFRTKREWAKQWHQDTKDSCSTNDNDLFWWEINKGQAEIHISLLAEKMYDALNESTPKQLKAGEWHIPFGDNIDAMELANLHSGLVPLTQDVINQMKLQVAVARCARISYQTFGDNPKIDYAADIKLHDMLASNGHASPFEHIAKAMDDKEYEWYGKMSPVKESTWVEGQLGYKVSGSLNEGWCRNFKGFIQYRELLEDGI